MHTYTCHCGHGTFTIGPTEPPTIAQCQFCPRLYVLAGLNRPYSVGYNWRGQWIVGYRYKKEHHFLGDPYETGTVVREDPPVSEVRSL